MKRNAWIVLILLVGVPQGALPGAWGDRQFAEEYARVIAEPNDPITGEEIEKVLGQLPRDLKIMQIYQEISGLGTLPPVR